jgi:hypothetical protein
MGRIGLSWELMRRCLVVLREEPGLLVLSLLGMVAGLLVAASFFVPMHAAGIPLVPGSSGVAGRLQWFLWALLYLVGMLVTTFTNAAVVAAALVRLRGGRLTTGEALRAAFACARPLAGWAILAGTVGYLLTVAQRHADLLGRVVGGLAGVAWSVATFLVIPVLVVEGVEARQAIARSTALVRRTWGEQVVSTVSFGYVFFLLAMPAVVVGVVFLLSWGTWPPFPWPLLTLAYVIGLGLVHATLARILQAALYLHAAGKPVGEPFDAGILTAALRSR